MYALPQTLAECGRVRTDATGPLYSVGIRALLTSVGIRALLTGTSRLERDPYVRAVRRHLDEASDALGEAIHLARVDGSDMAYLATRDSHEYLHMISRVADGCPRTPGRRGAGQGAARGACRRRTPAR